MTRITVDLTGLAEAHKLVRAIPAAAEKARAPAVNTTTRFAYAESSREIRKQVNFTRTYLGSAQAGNRLRVTKWASPDSPSATITGRKRATSLARFATNRSFSKAKGVTVRVKPGSSRRMASAFLLRLRAGAALTEDAFNVGLAVRVKPGQRVFNKRRMIQYSSKPRAGRSKADTNLYLLYGPSVDQVFRDVSADIEPSVQRKLQSEFLRQFERFING